MTTAPFGQRRGRGLFGLGLAGALAVALAAPAALAQLYGGGWGNRGVFGGGGYGHGYGYGQTANVGTVQGSVQSLDFENGRLTMRTTQGLIGLNARPQDLVGLNPGDVASVTFLDYGGARWLEPGGGGFYGGGFGGDFGFSGEVTGTVQRVDRQRGLVQIAGRTLRAHPEDVSDMYPGQFLSVGYVQVGKTAWADSTVGGGVYGGGIYGGGRYGTGIYGGGRYGTGFERDYRGGFWGGDVGQGYAVPPGSTTGDATGEQKAAPKKK